MDHASPLDLVPRPRDLRPGSGTVVLGDVVTVALDRELDGVWPLLSDVLGTRLGRRLVPVTGDDAHLAQVRVVHEPDLPEEGYRLEVAGAAGPGGAGLRRRR
ncbi:glycoside hydrolase family 20 zincin-like fold domain-containing protein [Salana multivorans]